MKIRDIQRGTIAIIRDGKQIPPGWELAATVKPAAGRRACKTKPQSKKRL